MQTERPNHYLDTQTVCTTSSDGPRATSAARTVRGVRADGLPNTFPPKTGGQPDRNEGTQEQAKNTKNTWAKRLHADSPHPPHGQSARCEPTWEQQPESQLESTLPPILPWISQVVEALEERFGEDVKRPQGMLCPKTWVLKQPKSPGIESPPKPTKNLGSNRNPSIGGRTQSLGDQDQAQRCTRQLSMIPTNKLETKHLRIKGTSRA
jgi:hypothetical protein